MKKSLVMFVLTFAFYFANSQTKVVLYYNENWLLTSKEKASFVREVELDMDNFVFDGKVTDSDLRCNKVMEGVYSNGKRNGEFIFYYANGFIESKGSYQNNLRNGLWEYFYPNSKIKQKVIFYPNNSMVEKFAVTDYFDRKGNQLVKNGTGKWIDDSIRSGLFEKTQLKRLTGKFKDSLKVGEWRLVNLSDGRLVHSETFVKGKFVSSVVLSPASNEYGSTSTEIMPKLQDVYFSKFRQTDSFEIDTTAFPKSLMNADVVTILKKLTGIEYEIRNRKAMYPDGDYDLFQFIASNIKYPQRALENKISGKVYIGVKIDSKGNQKEARVLFGLNKELDLEALRVISLIKKWLPEISEGMPVESSITIPVKFEIKD